MSSTLFFLCMLLSVVIVNIFLRVYKTDDFFSALEIGANVRSALKVIPVSKNILNVIFIVVIGVVKNNQ